MRTAKLILMAMVAAFVTVTLAHAGTQVQINQSAAVNASIKNTTSRSVIAAVKMTGYDDAGTKIGQLCKQAWLGAGKTTAVDFAWKSPSYATGVYWTAKVEENAFCPAAELPTYHDDDHDDDDHDDDHDDDADDSHH